MNIKSLFETSVEVIYILEHKLNLNCDSSNSSAAELSILRIMFINCMIVRNSNNNRELSITIIVYLWVVKLVSICIFCIFVYGRYYIYSIFSAYSTCFLINYKNRFESHVLAYKVVIFRSRIFRNSIQPLKPLPFF